MCMHRINRCSHALALLSSIFPSHKLITVLEAGIYINKPPDQSNSLSLAISSSTTSHNTRCSSDDDDVDLDAAVAAAAVDDDDDASSVGVALRHCLVLLMLNNCNVWDRNEMTTDSESTYCCYAMLCCAVTVPFLLHCESTFIDESICRSYITKHIRKYTNLLEFTSISLESLQ